jgi:hypothetical protein
MSALRPLVQSQQVGAQSVGPPQGWPAATVPKLAPTSSAPLQLWLLLVLAIELFSVIWIGAPLHCSTGGPLLQPAIARTSQAQRAML